MSESSSTEFNSYVTGKPPRAVTPKEANIRKWLAGLFMQCIKAGESLLENGNLAGAAATFANATLLTDRPDSFVVAVRRVYPNYFYSLFERRMYAMGYHHLFAKADPKPVRMRRSPDRADDGRNESSPPQAQQQ